MARFLLFLEDLVHVENGYPQRGVHTHFLIAGFNGLFECIRDTMFSNLCNSCRAWGDEAWLDQRAAATSASKDFSASIRAGFCRKCENETPVACSRLSSRCRPESATNTVIGSDLRSLAARS